jgi:hypothetical protein
MRKKILHPEQASEKPQQIKGGPFRLGRIGSLNQGLTALSRVIRATADGTIDSQLGSRLANMLGIHRQYLETMTLEKLNARLSELEGGTSLSHSPDGPETDIRTAPRGYSPTCVVVEAPQAFSEAALLAKHLELYPRDRRAKQTIFIRIFSPLPDPDARCEEHRNKAGAAWRMLAREERERGSWAIIGA